jgi:glycosyltransferase involved in cell wall biosynthesis
MICIVLPVRNGAKTIERALDSIANQTFFKRNPYKIFLVDNMSTDNLLDVIFKGGRKIHYIKCKELGVAPALNTGLFEALKDSEIDLIARIDADDEWLPDKITVQVAHMSANSLDICGTQMDFFSESGKFLKRSDYPVSHEEIGRHLITGRNPIGHPSVLFRKSILTYCGGYDENFKGAEDFDLWTRCYMRFRMGNTIESLVRYTLDQKDRSLGDHNAVISAVKMRNLYGSSFGIN